MSVGQPGPKVVNQAWNLHVKTYGGVSCRINGGAYIRNNISGGGYIVFAQKFTRPGTYALNVWCMAGNTGAGINRSVVVRQPQVAPQRVIYLTFDDGPVIATPLVLAELKKHGAKATFFAVGRMARTYPGMLKRIAADGHKLANHSYNHADLRTLSSAGIRNEILSTQAALGSKATKCMRPPYGSTDSRVAGVIAGLGMKQSLWHIDTNDWQRPSAASISNKVTANAFNGAVVLMHDGGGDGDNTAAALRTMLPKLKSMGYQMAVMPC
jgi:peptidoglycan/xylan/chitin deacetylase (PgdA/CDA1 family)